MSTVIKAGEAVGLKQRLVTVDLSDHLAEARTILENARREAQRIADAARREHAVVARSVEDAQQEARERGHLEGFEEGRARGLEEGRAAGFAVARAQAIERFTREQAHLTATLNASIAEFDRVKGELAVAAERDLLEFALLIARKLTFAIGSLHHEAAAANVTRALRLVDSRTDVQIHLSPADLAALEQFVESTLRPACATRHVNLVADESIAPGGCRLTTQCTGIDATLETQIAELTALLLGDSRPAAAREEPDHV